MKLFENREINKHAIKLIDGKQHFYKPIYILSLIELETLKIYIKTYLKTGFIQPSKFSVGAFIFFDKKFDSSLCFCIDYQDLNNFIIKN